MVPRTPSIKIGSETVEFELVFDGTGVLPSKIPGVLPFTDDGIAKQIERFKFLVFTFQGPIHSPYYLKLSWGKLLFQCRLSQLSFNYTLFKPDGTPLRARAHAVFIGFNDEATLALKANKTSPDLSHALTVRAGDTLPLMCFNTMAAASTTCKWPGSTVERLQKSGCRDRASVSAARKSRHMTVPSPLTGATALVSFTIKVAGKEIPSTFQVLSIDTWVAVNKVPKARIVIFDGNPATSNFEISDLDTFLPGKQLEIAAGYSQKDTPIFKGIIVKQGIEINQTQGSKLIVDISDEAIKMTLERKNDLFPKISDSELIGKLITSSGLEKDVAPTNPVLEQIVQYYATDWDLMMMRAELNGFVVMVEAGKVSVKEPDTKQTPVLRVKFGESILDFNAEMDAATQYQPSAIKSITWDVADSKTGRGRAGGSSC